MVFLRLLCSSAANEAEAGTPGELTVTNVWSRTAPAVAQNGVFYMTLSNLTESDEELQSVSTDACDVVELHEMYDKGDGLMGMRPAPGGIIPIAAGETVELNPGGLHIMCIGKDGEFKVDDTIPLTLQFAHAGEVAVTAVVKESDE